MWRQFDHKAISEDVAIMADLGISCIRIFLLWEDFQPRANKVNTAMLDLLVDFLEMATAEKLKVIPVLFTGYINGLTWLPSWMIVSDVQPSSSLTATSFHTLPSDDTVTQASP